MEESEGGDDSIINCWEGARGPKEIDVIAKLKPELYFLVPIE